MYPDGLLCKSKSVLFDLCKVRPCFTNWAREAVSHPAELLLRLRAEPATGRRAGRGRWPVSAPETGRGRGVAGQSPAGVQRKRSSCLILLLLCNYVLKERLCRRSPSKQDGRSSSLAHGALRWRLLPVARAGLRERPSRLRARCRP